MSKYIDAEKLIAEIERLLKCTELHRGEAVADGSRQTLYWIKDFITSLQQEQPEVDLEKEVQSFWNANALEYRLGHVADINFLAYTARHFYELGCRHTAEEADRIEFERQEREEMQPTIKGWVARDKDNAIILYSSRPKRERTGFWKGNKIKRLPDDFFSELTWENIPIEVELTISRVIK